MIEGVTAVEHRFHLVRGLRLHLLDFGGTGDPVLLLHGVGGTAWIWHAVAPALTVARRLLAVDLRGFGLSQRSAEHRYGTDDHADDLTELAALLGLRRLSMVGFSWGALVALALLRRLAPAVDRIALVDMPPSSPLGETDVNPIPYASRSHAEAVAMERGLAPRADQSVLERTVSLVTIPAPDGTGGFVRAVDPFFLSRWPFRSDDRWEELRAAEVPVLVVRGEQSPVLSASDADRMVSTAPDGRLLTIPDCGHLVPVEQPQALAVALLAFLGAAA
jgi:pimeloyl-ACP methyl ester carboxylesterase